MQRGDKYVLQAGGCLLVAVAGLFVFAVAVLAVAVKWVMG